MKYRTRKRKWKRRPACCCAVYVLPILLAFAAAVSVRKQIWAGELRSAGNTAAEQSQPGQQHVPEANVSGPDAQLCELMIKAATDGSWQFEFDPAMLQCESSDAVRKMVSDTFHWMWDERPELFFVACKCYTIPFADENGNYSEPALVELEPREKYKDQPVLEWYAEVRQAAEAILAQIPAGSSDAEKALFVHDYLVSNTVYDMEELRSEGSGTGYTVYGALVEHEAVCSGYSSAFRYLMQLLDIPCRYYSGKSVPDEGKQPPILEGVSGRHGWNCVWLESVPYWVDVTWDDPVDRNGNDAGGPVRHDYCFVDDETILRDHIFDSSYTDLPVCTDMTLHERLFSKGAASWWSRWLS